MKSEVFSELIHTLKKIEEKSFAAHQLGIDLMEYETQYSYAIWITIKAHYGKEAGDWIEWFLYERESLNGEINKAWDKEGNEICDTVESLWRVVEEMRTSPNFVEYSLPSPRDFDADAFMDILNNFFKPKSNED